MGNKFILPVGGMFPSHFSLTYLSCQALHMSNCANKLPQLSFKTAVEFDQPQPLKDQKGKWLIICFKYVLPQLPIVLTDSHEQGDR
jgi:hypothetical protein